MMVDIISIHRKKLILIVILFSISIIAASYHHMRKPYIIVIIIREKTGLPPALAKLNVKGLRYPYHNFRGMIMD